MPADMLGVAVVGAVLLVMGSGFSTYVIDLRSRTESADRIHQLSFNDTMTGLPNRIAFNERLAFDAAEAHEKAHKLAAFSIDLDGFKDINDLYGHGAGDLLLIEVAERMRKQLARTNFWPARAATNFWRLHDLGQPSARRPCLCGADRAGLCRAVLRSRASPSLSPPRSASRCSRPIRRNAINC